MESRSNGFSIILDILSTIMLFLLIAMLFRTMLGASSQPITFEGLLEVCSNAPALDIGSLPQFYVSGSWGPLDVLRAVVNSFATMINASLFICAQFINAINFVAYFFYSVFMLA